jgi:hypothetical protein
MTLFSCQKMANLRLWAKKSEKMISLKSYPRISGKKANSTGKLKKNRIQSGSPAQDPKIGF